MSIFVKKNKISVFKIQKIIEIIEAYINHYYFEVHQSNNNLDK